MKIYPTPQGVVRDPNLPSFINRILAAAKELGFTQVHSRYVRISNDLGDTPVYDTRDTIPVILDGKFHGWRQMNDLEVKGYTYGLALCETDGVDDRKVPLEVIAVYNRMADDRMTLRRLRIH